MIRKIETKLAKSNIHVITVIWILLMTFKGSLETYCQWEQAKIPTAIIEGNIVDQLIKVILLNVLAIIVLTTARTFGGTRKFQAFNQKRSILTRQLFEVDLGKLNETNVGKLSSNINTYANLYWSLSETVICTLISTIPLFVVLYKLYTQAGIGAVLINLLFVAIFAIMFAMLNSGKKIEKQQQKVRELNGIVTDNLMNIKTLRYLGKSEFALNRLDRIQMETSIEHIAIMRKLAQSIFWIAPFMAVCYNAYMFRDCKDISLLIFVCTETYGCLLSVSDSIAAIINVYQEYIVIKKQLDFLKKKTTRVETDIKSEVRVKECEFGYKDSDIIFKANMTFEKGKRYSITGESGQGKSTLANLLVGNLKPFKGHCDEVKTYYIHQETEILDSSLRDNICLGSEYPEEELIDLIGQIGLGEWFSELKDGFDTILGDRGNKVSSGQKQRINILRSVLKMKDIDDGTLIILDEPTSNLDDETEKLAVKMIDKYCKSTLMVVTHRPLITSICDHKYVVENHVFKQVD